MATHKNTKVERLGKSVANATSALEVHAGSRVLSVTSAVANDGRVTLALSPGARGHGDGSIIGPFAAHDALRRLAAAGLIHMRDEAGQQYVIEEAPRLEHRQRAGALPSSHTDPADVAPGDAVGTEIVVRVIAIPASTPDTMEASTE